MTALFSVTNYDQQLHDRDRADRLLKRGKYAQRYE
jgi:hypothetical protein